MKLKFYTEQVLTVLLVVILLPCAITLLLNSRMSRIYQAIQDETKYISIESGDKTEEISLEEYVLEVTASELPADTQIRVERHQEAVFEMPDTEPDGQQISAGPEPLLQAGPKETEE